MTVKNRFLISKSKHAQSDIVATLLIVLLVIVAGGLLLRFLIPYVSSWLSKGDCFQFNGKVEIINDPTYTCYDSATNSLYLKVGFGDFDDNSKNKVTGLMFLTQTENNMMTYELIPPNSNPPGVSLLTGDIGQLPEKNQERTYKIMNITIKPNSTIIYPLIDKKRKCAESGNTMDFIPFCGTGFMGVSSTAFISGGDIPAGFTADPTIAISNIPGGTTNFVIILENINDVGANNWIEYNIDKSINPIVPNTGSVVYSYNTITPPSGIRNISYYTFTVYALNDPITTNPTTKQQVLAAINKTNKLGQATLYGKIKGTSI